MAMESVENQQNAQHYTCTALIAHLRVNTNDEVWYVAYCGSCYYAKNLYFGINLVPE